MSLYVCVLRVDVILHFALPASVIHTSVQNMDDWSMDDNCGEWVESMGVASGRG